MPNWNVILSQIVNRKSTNALWFLQPTQLLIQGQWWSNRSTHWLQMAQCLDLGDLITLHSGQRSAGLMSLSKVKKSIEGSGLSTPGFLHDAHVKNTRTKANVAWLTYSKYNDNSELYAGKMKNMLDK